MPRGKIVHWTGSFKIKRSGTSIWLDFNPNISAHKLLGFGDSIKVPIGVVVTVKCLNTRGEENGKEFEVTNQENWVVSNWCYSNLSMRAEHLTATHLRTPEKLAEIAEYPVGKKFQIKRHSWAGFKDYHSTWGTGLYEGDQLKVPPGVTVKVRFENNEEVQVTDNNQPWDLLDNWQNQ